MSKQRILVFLSFLALQVFAHGGWAAGAELRSQRVKQQAPILLTGAKVLAPDASGWIQTQVLIVGNRIEALGPDLEAPSPAAQVISLDGKHLLPGLIDLHSHLLLQPYDEVSWTDQVLRQSLEFRTIRAVGAAQATLASGFTSLRELGTEGAAFADVALRDAIAQGIIPGPRVFASTRALVPTGCYGPSGFDPRWEVPKGAQVADGVDGVRIAVREQIAAGADWIKVYADYRRQPGGPSTPTYSKAELEAIVDEATSAGIPVAAHASTDAAIRRAVLAGAKTIEHGYGASLATLELMRKLDVVLCPTLSASESIARYSGWDGSAPLPRRVQQAREMFGRALAAGVLIGNGSDVGVFSHGDNALELELMVDYGMSNAQALRAATTVAAEVLGQGQSLGQIQAGFLADLVCVEKDPLASMAALRSPALVIKNGSIVLIQKP